MKRKQVYTVTIMHRAVVDFKIKAHNRDEAKILGLAAFENGEQLENDFTNLEAIVHKVKCLGTAENTKKRKT